MFFRTEQESRSRAQDLGIALADAGGESLLKVSAGVRAIRFNIDGCSHAPIALAKTFVAWLGDFSDCLLWVCEFGIWPSREDLNVYYRLRASYGDLRQLSEASGHLFFTHERSDIGSFLSLAIQFGWGAHVLTGPSWTYMFLSHDGWMLAASEMFHNQIITDLEARSISYEVLAKS